MPMPRTPVSILCATLLLLAGTASAQLTKDESKCLSKRAQATGKYQKCVQKWQAKCYGEKGCPQDKLSKCRDKYSARWEKLAALDAAPCTGDRWVDNEDGTVTDNLTALVWEQKTDDAGVHDQDNEYSWTSGDPYLGDGTAFTVLIENLNDGSGFAGANDWRVPTLAELLTILNQPHPCTISPCIDDAFGAYSTSKFHWAATTYEYFPTNAWLVSFLDGSQSVGNKTGSNGVTVRAVRHGW